MLTGAYLSCTDRIIQITVFSAGAFAVAVALPVPDRPSLGPFVAGAFAVAVALPVLDRPYLALCVAGTLPGQSLMCQRYPG